MHVAVDGGGGGAVAVVEVVTRLVLGTNIIAQFAAISTPCAP